MPRPGTADVQIVQCSSVVKIPLEISVSRIHMEPFKLVSEVKFEKTLEFLFQSNWVLLKYLPTNIATRIVK